MQQNQKNNVEIDFHKEIILNYIIHGHMGVIERWLDSDSFYSSHYIAKVLLETAIVPTADLLNIREEFEGLF